MVEPQPSKLMMRVRFPLPAPWSGSCSSGVEHTLGKGEVDGSIPSMSSIIKEGNDQLVIPFFVNAVGRSYGENLPNVIALANMPTVAYAVEGLFNCSNSYLLYRYRPVAQLAEQRSPKPQVGGSIPSWPANLPQVGVC